MTTPALFLKQAIKAVPAVKYALGIGGIAATVAIIQSFTVDLKVAFGGIAVMLVLMGVLVIFARMAALAGPRMLLPALVFTWFTLILFMAASILLFTSIFFKKPLDLSGEESIRIAADSGWVGGGSSLDPYCDGQKAALEKQYVARNVEMVGAREDQRAEYTPFMRAYYRYQCWFVIN